MNRGWSYRSTVAAGDDGTMITRYLAGRYSHSTAETWTARLAAGQIEIDGRVANAATVLRRGQVVVWHRPPWTEPDVPLHFDVLYEDDHLVAVAKPSGLPTMPAGGFLEHTLLHLVRACFPEARPLHRLGRFTSGVVVFARSHDAAAVLARTWREHAVQKDYRALVGGVPAWERLEVSTPIGPVPHPGLGAVFAASPAGRPAHSALTVVERRDATTLLDVRIATGRPHQIRIHCAWSGYPLAGDALYAVGGGPHAVAPALPGDGGYLLHAHRVRCAHPHSGAPLLLESTPPPALRKGLRET